MRRKREIIICFEHWPCRGSECLPPSKPWKRRRRFPCTWGWRDPGSGAGTWCAHQGPWWQSWRLQRGHQPDQSASSWASGLGRSAAGSVQGRSRRSRWRTSGWLQWGEQPCPCTGQRIPPSEWSGRHSRWCPVNREGRRERRKKERVEEIFAKEKGQKCEYLVLVRGLQPDLDGVKGVSHEDEAGASKASSEEVLFVARKHEKEIRNELQSIGGTDCNHCKEEKEKEKE